MRGERRATHDLRSRFHTNYGAPFESAARRTARLCAHKQQPNYHHHPSAPPRFLKKKKKRRAAPPSTSPPPPGLQAATLLPKRIILLDKRKGQHKARAMDVTTNPTLSHWALHPHLLRWPSSLHHHLVDDDDDDDDDHHHSLHLDIDIDRPALSPCDSLQEQPSRSSSKQQQQDRNEWLDVQRLLEQEEEEWLLIC